MFATTRAIPGFLPVLPGSIVCLFAVKNMWLHDLWDVNTSLPYWDRMSWMGREGVLKHMPTTEMWEAGMFGREEVLIEGAGRCGFWGGRSVVYCIYILLTCYLWYVLVGRYVGR